LKVSQSVTHYIVTSSSLTFFQLPFNFHLQRWHGSSVPTLSNTSEFHTCSGSSFAVVLVLFCFQNDRPFPVRPCCFMWLRFSMLIFFLDNHQHYSNTFHTCSGSSFAVVLVLFCFQNDRPFPVRPLFMWLRFSMLIFFLDNHQHYSNTFHTCSGSSFAVVLVLFCFQNDRPFPVRPLFMWLRFSMLIFFYRQPPTLLEHFPHLFGIILRSCSCTLLLSER
jgi:ABC-type Fe3+-siderophore transport system permease subunit